MTYSSLTQTTAILLVFLLFICNLSHAFYSPGVVPRDYYEQEPVSLKVNKVDSVKTQMPYEFYSLPFCRPEKIVDAAANLGELLSGDKIQSSLYDVSVLVKNVHIIFVLFILFILFYLFYLFIFIEPSII